MGEARFLDSSPRSPTGALPASPKQNRNQEAEMEEDFDLSSSANTPSTLSTPSIEFPNLYNHNENRNRESTLAEADDLISSPRTLTDIFSSIASQNQNEQSTMADEALFSETLTNNSTVAHAHNENRQLAITSSPTTTTNNSPPSYNQNQNQQSTITSSPITMADNSPPALIKQERMATPDLPIFHSPSASYAKDESHFVPAYIEEWLTLLSKNGFIDGTHTSALWTTDFAPQSVKILASWLFYPHIPTPSSPLNATSPKYLLSGFNQSTTQPRPKEPATAEIRKRGRIIGHALFEACFGMRPRINIWGLGLHLEELANLFMKLIDDEERKEREEGIEGNLKVMEWLFALFDSMVTKVEEDLKALGVSAVGI